MTNQAKQPLNPETPSDRPKDQSGKHLKRRYITATLLLLSFAVGLGSGFLLWGRQAHCGETQSSNQPELGPPDAPITIIEFSDFTCGYCRKFHLETFNQLLDTYPDQIRFIYRNFPVVGGFEAALASLCAGEQGKYWEYHDLLFTGDLAMGRSAYLQYAEKLGLDTEALSECIDSERFTYQVEADYTYARSMGISGTPAFLINGIPVVGAQPLEVFIQIIDAELNK